MKNKLVLTVAGLVVCLLVAGSAYGDSVPMFAGVPHIDPYIQGWPLPAPPTGPGQVNVTPWYAVIGPAAMHTERGLDGLFAPLAPHIWENEFDLDILVPLGPIALVGFGLLGGGILGPFPVPLVPGPDIYLAVIQQDIPAELGPTWRSCANLTPVPIGWGVSVVEDPEMVYVDQRKIIEFPGNPGLNFSITENAGFCDGFEISQVGDMILITQVPEPATLVLLGLGGLALLRKHRA